MTTVPLKALLAVSGLITIGLGAMILFDPVSFYASYGLDLGGQITLLNEMRSHGLSLVGIGLFIGAGAVVARLTTVAIAVSGLFYLSYGLSRLVGMAFDGLPAQGLVIAAATELAVGSVSLLIYVRRSSRSALANI